MADAAVEFLLENLKQLLIYHTKLIYGAKDEILMLEKDLRLLRAFLRDTSKKRHKDDNFRELIRQIRDVVYDAEDIIDRFVTDAADIKRQHYLKFFKRPVSLHDIAKRVNIVSSEVDKIYGDKIMLDFAVLNMQDEDPEEAVPFRQDNIVGFEDVTAKIIGYLTESKPELDVISIVGMAGLGKTTLAGKIFHDEIIQYEFPIRIWVHVNQDFSQRAVYLTILENFIQHSEDMHQKPDVELARMVYELLGKLKFLIVIDNLWSAFDWDKIKNALPKYNGGKVLITSRQREVGKQANHDRPPHDLRLFTLEESCLLLKYEVFGKPECPREFEVPLMQIAQQCEGLPLAIVIMGGFLVRKICRTDDMQAQKDAWEKVSKSVGTYLYEDPERRMESIIAISYDKLPYDLRACFLYLGMFPEDFEIPVWKLIQIWIAEGFIQRREGESQEEIAQSYLDDLINRNLVRADKRRHNGSIKTCRISKMLRDFCIREAQSEKENVFQEIKSTSEGFERSVAAAQKSRRICIHSNVVNFLSHKPFGPRARSFVCFSKEDTALPLKDTAAIPAGFKLLRVLDVIPIKFEKIPSDMFLLVHLRYIALSFNLKILPAGFAKLWNLETLIVNTSSPTLAIKVDIWKMSRLRHLKTNASATLYKVEGKDKGGENLQSLGTISPESCTEKVFDKARNLKKLSIGGVLAVLRDGEAVSFNNLAYLRSLEKLKLLNDVSHGPVLECLPPPYSFPPTLRSLTLSRTSLNWDQMSILGYLESLQVLKLKDKAFIGKILKAKDGGFRQLEVLHIGRTDLEFWIASGHHYPRLRRLHLYNCEDLTEIPTGLAEIPSFQILDVFRSSKAVRSAIKIREVKQNIEDGDFKLSIFPPHNLD